MHAVSLPIMVRKQRTWTLVAMESTSHIVPKEKSVASAVQAMAPTLTSVLTRANRAPRARNLHRLLHQCVQKRVLLDFHAFLVMTNVGMVVRGASICAQSAIVATALLAMPNVIKVATTLSALIKAMANRKHAANVSVIKSASHRLPKRPILLLPNCFHQPVKSWEAFFQEDYVRMARIVAQTPWAIEPDRCLAVCRVDNNNNPRRFCIEEGLCKSNDEVCSAICSETCDPSDCAEDEVFDQSIVVNASFCNVPTSGGECPNNGECCNCRCPRFCVPKPTKNIPSAGGVQCDDPENLNNLLGFCSKVGGEDGEDGLCCKRDGEYTCTWCDECDYPQLVKET